MSESAIREPQIDITIGDTQITLLGTAHVSRTSAERVAELIDSEVYDAVAVELCPSRYNHLLNPDLLARMDLFAVLKEGKAPLISANLALSAYQQRLAEKFDIEPGADMQTAIEKSMALNRPVLLIDRDLGITLKRVYSNIPWWQRLNLFSGLIASIVSKEEIEESDIEKLKQGDVLENTFRQFAEEEQAIFSPLIDERDRYMAMRLLQESRHFPNKKILAVVGAGHLSGIQRYLQEHGKRENPERELNQLDETPPPSTFWRVFPWLIVALVIIGFTIGFARSPELGWEMVINWVLINGGLSAIGAAIAGGHILTVIGAFLAAPLTSLNPTVGAGMATAAIELWVRKPTVADFGLLRHDTSSLKGWWENPVSRTLLVFMFSTLGSAIGTYVAGFKIAELLLN